MKPSELDKSVMLAIEAAKTHEMVHKLFYVCCAVLFIAFLFLIQLRFYDPFSSSAFEEEGIILVYYKNHYENVNLAFEAAFLILLLLTITFRADFPFNLSILIITFFYFGFIFGTVVQRNAYTQLDDDFTCVSEED